MTTLVRKIVQIDQEKCDGCGQCIPNCAEGALRIVNGKAQLVADKLCDGLGACLGTCPRGAITVEERAADAFDEAAVHAHLAQPSHPRAAHGSGDCSSGQCPGTKLRVLSPPAAAALSSGEAGLSGRASRLRQWPVQLALVPPSGPIWEDADVLIAADCVPFALGEFHEQLLAGKTLAIACPKLDDPSPALQKLAMIFANNAIRSITVARMEVPCCRGLVRLVEAALAHAGREDLAIGEVVVSIDGRILQTA